jgi:hypothetical protein
VGKLGPGVVSWVDKNLWPECTEEVVISVQLDLNNVTWPAVGQTKIFSAWMDKEVLTVTYKDKSGKKLTGTEASNLGIKYFSLRFSVAPQTVGTAILYCSVSPFSKDDLETAVQVNGSALSSNHIPTAAVRVGKIGGKLINGLVV